MASSRHLSPDAKDPQVSMSTESVPSIARSRGPLCPIDRLDELVERTLPAVATIQVADGSGSGFVIGTLDRTLVATNKHVLGDADDCAVAIGGHPLVAAHVVARDEGADIALVALELPDGVSVPPLTLRRHDYVRVGEPVMSIGSPLGFEATVSLGVVSGIGRYPGSPSEGAQLQTDALVHPGSSGGPLVGLDGFVVGMNTSGLGETRISFALTTDVLGRVLTHMVAGDAPRRASLGIRARHASLDPEVAFLIGQRHAVEVTQAPDTLQTDGLRPGDLIVEMAGLRMNHPADLATSLLAIQPGELVRVRIVRDGKAHEIMARAGQKGEEEGG